MECVLTTLFNMSLSAGWIALAVLLMRPLLYKMPKWLHCALWCPVALRLLIPIFPESRFSLLPSAQVLPDTVAQRPLVQTGIAAVNDAVNPVLTQVAPGTVSSLISLLFCLWAVGAVLLLGHSVISYLRLRHQVQASMQLQDRVYLCDSIDTPFILGVLCPRIYVPSALSGEALVHVLAHEQAHLRRRDHWWKPLGYLLLCLHWFNPLLWAAYALLCRDIEKACDEKVISHMDTTAKRSYSEALLSCSVHRKAILACPLAFGENAVKSRIKRILHYKKPGFWLILGAVAVILICVCVFLTDPPPCAHTYQEVCTRAPTCTAEGELTYTCSQCWDSYTQPAPILAHSMGEAFVSLEATCAAEGTVSATCNGCGQSFVTESIPKTQLHDFQYQVLQESTCAAEGQAQNVCSVCKLTEAVSIPKTEHNYRVSMTMRPTCISEGATQLICRSCGQDTWEYSPPNGEHYYTITGFNGARSCMFCGKSLKSENPQSNPRNLFDDLVFPHNP